MNEEKKEGKVVNMEGKKDEKKKENMLSLTVNELELANQIMNMRSMTGMKIKDIRMIDKVCKKIKGVLPERPKRPEVPKPASGDKYTPEENKANQELIKKWSDEVKVFGDKEIEFEMTSFDKLTLKQKIAGFDQYTPDERSREVIISLADKLGIE